MSGPDSPAHIIARFLRANHYDQTLQAFIQEAGLPQDAGSLKPGSWTIEQILQEKTQFDKSLQFEKRGQNEVRGWTGQAPSVAYEPQVGIASNVLCVSGDLHSSRISVTSADRSWKQLSTTSPYQRDDLPFQLGDSPILSTVSVSTNHVLSTAMSGHLSLRRADSLVLIDECRHHTKYAVQVASHQTETAWLIATAGWDQKVHVYSPDLQLLALAQEETGTTEKATQPGLLGQPIHTISLPSNPESLLFARHPDTGVVHLVVSRRDSTHLYFYQIHHESAGDVRVVEAGRQNLAPHSNAWVAFTPCSLAICPTDPTLVAVATSHIPHMKLIVARLLFPGPKTDTNLLPVEMQTQASVARSELALQDKEDAAITIHVSTLAPQTPYSTPQVVWRPDGSGLFVNGDDGVIRGVEATTGKVVSLLTGHEAGSKVRTLWAGSIKTDDSSEHHEVLISGGFDKKLLIWTVAPEA